MKWPRYPVVPLAIVALALNAGAAPAPDHSRVPGVVVAHSPAASRVYLGAPGVAILPDGTYLAKYQEFGPGSTQDTRPATHVSRSTDRGRSWEDIAQVPILWANIFCYENRVYLMGVDRRYGNVVLRCSQDGGRTWTEPRDADSGFLAEGRYHTAATPLVVHDGRIWRAMEDAKGPAGWARHFGAFMMSAPVDADWLKASSWTASNALRHDAGYLKGQFGGWLEGNAVVDPQGRMVNMLRVDFRGVPEKAALVRISADGAKATFDPQRDFITFPGGCKKFVVHREPGGPRYWTLSNPVLPQHVGYNVERTRNAVALMSSPDLRHWTTHAVVLYHPDVTRHAFQYLDWHFEEDDIVALARTAYDDGLGGARNQHDANYITFHRFANFRQLNLEDSVVDVDPKALKKVGMDTASSGNRWTERQVTNRAQGHVLTNTQCWSPDGRWLVYDVRRQDDVFDGPRIERVNVETGEVQVLYEARRGAHCGVVTYSPVEDRVVFIHGPENPTPDWQYAAYHRRGVLVECSLPGKAVTLDARDLTEPLTPGALRGGTHVHVFSGDGRWVSFTYEDHLLAPYESETVEHEVNLRNVGVSVPAGPVEVKADHPRNHSGAYFSVLVSATVAEPTPGSDEISRAFSDAWVGTNGYLKPDGTRQEKALAFQGHVRPAAGETISEVFVVDLPDDVTRPGPGGPLQGTRTTRPRPPAGARQRRLTYTADRKHPGLQGPRHWLRSSPDGAQIAFLMKDDQGIVQVWTVSPNGGPPRQVTRNRWDVASAFSWSPDGRHIAYVMDQSVFATDVATGRSERLTTRADDATAPTRHACVFSPDGRKIAYMRPMPSGGTTSTQIVIVERP